MTPESLTAFGFREYPLAPHDKHERHWCYTVRDERGHKLSVHVRFWENSKYGGHDGFDAWVYFENDHGFEIKRPCCSEETPESVVAWFVNVFERMGCKHYERECE